MFPRLSKKAKFSDAVDLMIKQNMYSWCHSHNKPDDYVDYNIKRFINFFEFSEDDLTFDNLKRWYYRERERLIKRKKDLKPIELSFPLLLTEQDQDIASNQIAMFWYQKKESPKLYNWAFFFWITIYYFWIMILLLIRCLSKCKWL